jgi:hypothetical protein
MNSQKILIKNFHTQFSLKFGIVNNKIACKLRKYELNHQHVPFFESKILFK